MTAYERFTFRGREVELSPRNVFIGALGFALIMLALLAMHGPTEQSPPAPHSPAQCQTVVLNQTTGAMTTITYPATNGHCEGK